MISYNHRVWGRGTSGTELWRWGAVKTRFLFRQMSFLAGSRIKSGTCSVLEVGCGGGQFLRALKRQNPQLDLWGIDISTLSLSYARSFNSDISYKRSSAEKLPFADQTFSVVYLFDVIEHINDPKKVLSEVHRVLAPNGFFVSATPLEESLTTLTGILNRIASFHPKESQLGHVNRFSRHSLLEMIQESGFEISETRYSTHILSQILDLVVSLLRSQSRNPEKFAVNEYICNQRTIFRIPLKAVEYCIVTILNLESLIFAFVPGLTLMVSAQRRKS